MIKEKLPETKVNSDEKTSVSARPQVAPSISVFFPCYNEQNNITRTVEQAVAVLDKIDADFEVIIVDDGSSDATGQIADGIASRDSRVKVVHHPTNLGYGAALQSGFKAATKKFVFYADGDGQFDINELPPLLPLIEQYDIVSCYRLNRQDRLIRRINGWCWTKLVCLLFGMKIRDIDCAFKLFKREIFDDFEFFSAGALIAAEILARAICRGYSVTQTGVHHYPRTAGTQTGGSLRVIFRAFKELFRLYSRIRSEHR